MWPFAGILDASGAGIDNNIEVHSNGQSVAGCHAGIRFNEDGSLEQVTAGDGTVYTVLGFDDTGYHDNADVSTGGEVDHTGAYVVAAPSPGIGSSFEARVTDYTTGSFDGHNDFPINTWVNLSTSPRLTTTRTGGKEGQGTGTDQATCTMEFRFASGALISTFTLRAISHRT